MKQMDGDGRYVAVRRILGISYGGDRSVRSTHELQKRGKLPTIPLVCGSQSAYISLVNRRQIPLESFRFLHDFREAPINKETMSESC